MKMSKFRMGIIISTGHHVDPRRHPNYFAARDIVISFSLHNTFSMSLDKEDSCYILTIIDLLCDILTLNRPRPKPSDHDIEKRVSLGLPWIIKKLGLLTVTEQDLATLYKKVDKTPLAYPLKTCIDTGNSITPENVGTLHGDPIHLQQIRLCVLLCTLKVQYHPSFSLELENMILFLITVFAKGPSPSDNFIRTKNRALTASGYTSILALDLARNMTGALWAALDPLIKNNTIDLKKVITNLQTLGASVDNIAIKPLFNQIAHKNLTYVSNIVQAVSSISDFPWGALFAQKAVLAGEFTILKSALESINENPYLGLEATGFGALLKHLAYLSTQLLIEMGHESLKMYQGVGSKKTQIMNKAFLDGLIQAHMTSVSDCSDLPQGTKIKQD